MDIIKEFLEQHVIKVTIYSFSITTVLLILIFRSKSLKNKYLDWKRDTLKLPFFSREWERNEDALLLELYSENENLNKKLNILQKENMKLSLISILILLTFWVQEKLKIKKKTSG